MKAGLSLLTTYQDQINLTDIIAPAFYEVHWDILDGKHIFYDLYGGRGSTKSSFISTEIVFGMMQDAEDGIISNAVVFRKVKDTIKDSVYEQIQWAIDELGVSDEWESTISPMKFVYKKTGQKIIFRGLDRAKKTKSIKSAKGYFKYLWFEELDEYDGEDEIRTIEQSVLRGGNKYVVFKSFNPPISVSNWANIYVNTPKKNAYRHKSDYRSVPEKWLGKIFLDEAAHLKETKPKAYEHEYLGNPVGLGTNIFDMLEIREIKDEEILKFDKIYQGQDWGWFPDPKAFIRLYYNHNTETIYLIDELGGCKIRNAVMAEQIRKKGYDDYTIYCGVDEQESIVDFRDAGLPARQAVAGPGSVKYTYEWLQCRTIVIDPSRTPKAYKEIIEYEHEVDKNGEVIANYPDFNNHWIDAIRYATSSLSMRRGNSA